MVITHLLFLFFGAGLFYLIPKPEIKLSEKRFSQNYQFINPLLECEMSSFSQNQSYNRLKDKITDYLDTQDGQVSVYVRDLNNGPWLGIEEKELFAPASLIKVPLMMTYLKAAESNPQILQKEIVYTPLQTPIQTIEPNSVLIPDKKYTVWELIEHMIVYSDNQAYETLFNYIDNNLVQATYSQLGIDISKWFKNPNGDIIDVKTYASFFRILFNASYVSNDFSEIALKLLAQTDYNRGLTSKLPPNVIVAHKFGERLYEKTGERQIHECGIVYLPKKPYLICVMSRGQDINQLESTIQQVSLITYQHLSQ